MAGKKIQIPSNIQDYDVLKRVLTQIVETMNTNPLIVAENEAQLQEAISSRVQANDKTPAFKQANASLVKLQNDTKHYVQKDIETKIKSVSGDVTQVAEQFGTFQQQALSAAWYGLTVQTGNIISGFTVGGVDTDTTTPGTEGSFFAINANKFSVGKAIDSVTDPAELAYLQNNNLPYGTMYDAQNNVIPAFIVEWDGANQGYNIIFNGVASFNNLRNVPDFATEINSGTTTIDGAKITTGSITSTQIQANSINADRINTTNLQAEVVKLDELQVLTSDNKVTKASFASTSDVTQTSSSVEHEYNMYAYNDSGANDRYRFGISSPKDLVFFGTLNRAYLGINYFRLASFIKDDTSLTNITLSIYVGNNLISQTTRNFAGTENSIAIVTLAGCVFTISKTYTTITQPVPLTTTSIAVNVRGNNSLSGISGNGKLRIVISTTVPNPSIVTEGSLLNHFNT